MDEKEFVSIAERDAFVVDAIRTSIVAMSLTTGCSINREGAHGKLDFDRQLAKLQTSLFLLGAEVDAAS